MNDTSVQISGVKADYRPLETVHGTVSWNLAKPPKSMAVNLFWHTEGRGDTDIKVVGSLPLEAPGVSGSRSFDLKIPEGPFSFSGKLISLSWGIEVVADGGRESTRIFFLMTPDGKEISIG